MTRPERGNILVETAAVATHERHAGGQHILRLRAPAIAGQAHPGMFVHADCGPEWLLRRPMSIMSADTGRGTIELLFKEVGHGTVNLGALASGDQVSLLGPIGNHFSAIPGRSRRILLGGGVGIPPIVFLAETEVAAGEAPPWVLAGSELPFPLATAAASLDVPGAPAAATLALARLEAHGIPNRLASRMELPGTFRGYVTELADAVIRTLRATERARLALYACGPTPMLAAVAALARRYQLPCQVSLEEYMACGVGGCAGCTVEAATPDGPAMKRVCVDGPVFDAAAVFPEQPLPPAAETPID